MYEIAITRHARERWVERVVDPERYQHLSVCNKNCHTCISLINDLKNVIRIAGHSIDGRIAAAYKYAKDHNSIITDRNFIEIQKQYKDITKFEFYLFKKAVLVVGFEATSEGIPLLLTVLTQDMIDGTVIKNSNNLKNVFKIWKHELKTKKFNKHIPNL